MAISKTSNHLTSINTIDQYPDGRPLTADQITEFHAARILLLLHLCGVNNRIEGLTKLAKLDFFVRYPDFFQRAKAHEEQNGTITRNGKVDSLMVRYHYGPWDPRYYQLLPYLESRELITVTKKDTAFVFSLTDAGLTTAKQFAQELCYRELCAQMRQVKAIFGNKSGDKLKKLVYSLFEEEVTNLPLGKVIQP